MKNERTGIELPQQCPAPDLRLFPCWLAGGGFSAPGRGAGGGPAIITAPGPSAAPVIRRRFAGASYAFGLACGDEALAAAAGSGGSAGEWLSERPAMLKLAQRAGLENFEKYFLSGVVFSPAAAGRACGLTSDEAAALKNFTDAFIMAHERVPAAALPALYLRWPPG